ncbi:MAG TPA: hypothetical protein DDY16_05370, partial [Tenacibaculum sp.]|nr:hypothetical protein [Tenacibaculum sp.]
LFRSYPKTELTQLMKTLFTRNSELIKVTPIQQQLLDSVIYSFIAAIYSAYDDVKKATLKNTVPSNISFRKGYGHIHSKIGLSQNMEVLISGGLLVAKSQFKPRPVEVKSTLVANELLREEELKLSVNIDKVKISLGMLKNLSPGDTLLTTTKIQDPVKVSVDTLDVALGYLCQHEGKKSIQLIGNKR